MTPERAARLGRIARKTWDGIKFAGALLVVGWVIPFWAVGFLTQAAWMGFQGGRHDFEALDGKMRT